MKINKFFIRIHAAWRTFLFYPFIFLLIGVGVAWIIPEKWEVQSVIAPPAYKSFGLESPANLATKLRSPGTLSSVAKAVSAAEGGRAIDIRSALRIAVLDKFVEVRVESSSPQLGVLISTALLDEVNRQEREYLTQVHQSIDEKRELVFERLRNMFGGVKGGSCFNIPVAEILDLLWMDEKNDLSKFFIQPSYGKEPSQPRHFLILVSFFIFGLIIAFLRVLGSDLRD